VVAARRENVFAQYVNAVFSHMWEKELKMDEPEIIRTALSASGFDAEN
jgi:2-hydroxychromene-2-carboxylate isomerase